MRKLGAHLDYRFKFSLAAAGWSAPLFKAFVDIPAIRKQLKTLRSQLSLTLRQEASLKVQSKLKQLEAISNASYLAAYLSYAGEIDLTDLFPVFWENQQKVFLPILDPDREGYLLFARYQADTKLRSNQFGILEPIVSWEDHIEPSQLDIVLTPLVAYDNQLNRLGTGGGYYDRTFQFRNTYPDVKKPLLIGCAYQFQKVESLIRAPWDVKLDEVVTDSVVL